MISVAIDFDLSDLSQSFLPVSWCLVGQLIILLKVVSPKSCQILSCLFLAFEPLFDLEASLAMLSERKAIAKSPHSSEGTIANTPDTKMAVYSPEELRVPMSSRAQQDFRRSFDGMATFYL